LTITFLRKYSSSLDNFETTAPREEHRLRALRTGFQLELFGPKGEDVTGEWRKLGNQELLNLYSSPKFIE
jgi:hypothetical protein